VCDNRPIEPPRRVDEGYHLTEDLVDQSIGMIRDLHSIVPERPFFLYLATGATHAPHQSPEAFRRKYRGASMKAGTCTASACSSGRRRWV
jgi:arylsulfatase